MARPSSLFVKMSNSPLRYQCKCGMYSRLHCYEIDRMGPLYFFNQCGKESSSKYWDNYSVAISVYPCQYNSIEDQLPFNEI